MNTDTLTAKCAHCGHVISRPAGARYWVHVSLAALRGIEPHTTEPEKATT